jgi:hypothetical protein
VAEVFGAIAQKGAVERKAAIVLNDANGLACTIEIGIDDSVSGAFHKGQL